MIISILIMIITLYVVFNIYNQHLRRKVLFIEGNIGTGKTTFLSKLEELGDYEIIYEPVDIWRQLTDSNDKNLLQTFYDNIKRYSYLFQSFAFKSRLEKMMKPQKKQVRIVERSVFTDQNVFAQNCFNNGLMTLLEWKVYRYWFNWCTKLYEKAGYNVNPDAYIYLRALPQTSYDRIRKRDRSEEESISLEYLTQISNLHDNWLKGYFNKIPVLVIDCNKDFESDNKYFDKILVKIKTLISQI